MPNTSFNVAKLNVPKVAANKFTGPTYIKNAPKNFNRSDYKKISKYDYDNDGVVDYNTINEPDDDGSGGASSSISFSSMEEFIDYVEPKFTKRNYTREKEIQILESIKEKVNQSVENEIYNSFYDECKYKFGVDLTELDSSSKNEEALKEFKDRLEKEREYYKKYYTWLYFNNEVGSTYDNKNVLNYFSIYFGTPWTVYEAYSFSEMFKGFSYEDFMSIMTDEEIAYYNYQFKIKYLEHYYSADLRGDYPNDNLRKMNAIEFARKEVDNEMFHKQSFEKRMGQLAALKIVKNMYFQTFRELKLNKSNEITMKEAFHYELKNETVLTKDGKFYKVDLVDGVQLLRGPDGKYYTYYADTSLLSFENEFSKWFYHSFKQEPFTIFKGAMSIFAKADDLRSFNKSDYEKFYLDDVATRTFLGSRGYEIGAKTFDIVTDKVIEYLGGTKADCATFWAVVGYGIGRKNALKMGYSESTAKEVGFFSGASLAATEFIPDVIDNFAIHKFAKDTISGFLGITYLYGQETFANLVVETKEYDLSMEITEDGLRDILNNSDIKLSAEDKETFIDIMVELFSNNDYTYKDFMDLIDSLKK